MKRKLTSAETEYVFDYFIKDYLGNVRAVVTEEDAEFTDKFLATMEEVHAVIEEENFDNLDDTRQELPTSYPLDGSIEFNERIAELTTENGTEIGPSLVMSVKRGEKIKLSTKYFYEEDAQGQTYPFTSYLIDEIMMSLATSGVGVIGLNETQLLNIASGQEQVFMQNLGVLLDNEFDTTDVTRPHAYLVWMFYDSRMELDIGSSGAIQVTNPNSLETIISNELPVAKDGYLHAYVSNGTESKVNFDNFLVVHQRGKLRQINDYYPYGLALSGINDDHNEYLNKYTSKELQTGEFDPNLSTGLEMFDFGSRFYDPQLGVWFTPDPAEQFHNPYLGIGNNPVMYVDPDGEFIDLAAGLLFQGLMGGFSAKENGGNFWNGFAIGTVTGGLGMAAGAGINSLFGSMGNTGVLSELGYAAAHGVVGGSLSSIQGGKFTDGFASSALAAYSTGGLETARAKHKFASDFKSRWFKYYRGTLDDNGFGLNQDGFNLGNFETGLVSGETAWKNFKSKNIGNLFQNFNASEINAAFKKSFEKRVINKYVFNDQYQPQSVNQLATDLTNGYGENLHPSNTNSFNGMGLQAVEVRLRPKMADNTFGNIINKTTNPSWSDSGIRPMVLNPGLSKIPVINVAGNQHGFVINYQLFYIQ